MSSRESGRRDQNLRTRDWNNPIMDRSLSLGLNGLSRPRILLASRIHDVLMVIQGGYYPILAAVGVPVDLVTIYVLLYKDCGLSPCVRRYLGAMAVADLLAIILDLILRKIPIVYREQFYFLVHIPVCNIHAVLLYVATDCSVWFTVTFTFDRFVAICCQKLKSKYCSEKTAAVHYAYFLFPEASLCSDVIILWSLLYDVAAAALVRIRPRH
ncbi:uncharacterized protein LOC132209913 [Stegostoma tigrinum]|uniref:uncharacterized protein LOC132209913 n=1 Tax=Stegostoma tigrinum TaxID=3053191 RepID=UPI002870A559|nr:uncharacterized protein LOC132209913 [Stegostoma tigrinum]